MVSVGEVGDLALSAILNSMDRDRTGIYGPYRRDPQQAGRELFERLIEKAVTYTLELDGKLFVIENVPARVNEETGEQFFSPQTVERLQEIIEGAARPVRVIETPVFDYAA